MADVSILKINDTSYYIKDADCRDRVTLVEQQLDSYQDADSIYYGHNDADSTSYGNS